MTRGGELGPAGLDFRYLRYATIRARRSRAASCFIARLAASSARRLLSLCCTKAVCPQTGFCQALNRLKSESIQRFNDSLFRFFPFSLGNDYALFPARDAGHLDR